MTSISIAGDDDIKSEPGFEADVTKLAASADTAIKAKLREFEAMEKTYKSRSGGKKCNSTHSRLTAYSKLLSEPHVNGLCEIVEASKESWKQINDALESLREALGDKEVLEVKLIHNDYWNLLLKTSRVVGLLTKRSRIRLRYVKSLITLLGRRDRLTESDKKRFHTNLKKTLADWADKELNELMNEWENIGARLLRKEEEWTTLFSKATVKAVVTISKKKIIEKVVFTIGGVAALTAALAICVVTAGLAVPIEAAICAAVIGGATCSVGGLALFNYKKNVAKVFSAEQKETIRKLREKLTDMKNHCNKIQHELSDAKGKVMMINEEVVSCEDVEAEDMRMALEAIRQNLEEFAEQGKQTREVVEAACKAYLKQTE